MDFYLLGPFLANSANPVEAVEVDAAPEVPANCEKSTAVRSMPSCEAPFTPEEAGETEAAEAAKLEKVGVLDETDAALSETAAWNMKVGTCGVTADSAELNFGVLGTTLSSAASSN